MKLSSLWFGLLLAVGIFGVSTRAEAVMLTLDGSWQIGNETSDGKGGFEFGEAWVFESKASVQLCLLDMYVIGDVFEVYDNAVLLGKVEGFDPQYPGDFAWTPEEGLELGSFSSACWILEPGEHSITIRTLQRPIGVYGDDAGGIALSAREGEIPQVSVPEGGASLLLLGASLAGMIGLRRMQTFARPTQVH